MPRSDPTDLTIEILEGPQAGTIITLAGRELPYNSGGGGAVSFGRAQRTKLTWYQGNRRASHQIIGPTLKPTTFDGIWKERYIGEDRPIDLCETFEDICDSGVQLRVGWSTIERQGVLHEFTWKPGDPTGGLGDIRWEAIFEWNFDPRKPASVVIGKDDLSLRDGLVEAASLVTNLSRNALDFLDGVRFFVGLTKTLFSSDARAVEAQTEALIQPTTTLVATAATASDSVRLPARKVEDASAAAGAAQRASAELGEVVSAIFPARAVDNDGLEAIMADALARADLVDDSYDSVEELYEQRQRLEAIVRPEEFKVVTAEPGTDLRRLSTAYLGSPDFWDRIARVNGFVTSKIPENIEEVIIPLSVPDATDLKRTS